MCCMYVVYCVCVCVCDLLQLLFLQQFQNILNNRVTTYQMAPGTLSVVVSDKVFFAAGYHGNKVSKLCTTLSLCCLCVPCVHVCI